MKYIDVKIINYNPKELENKLSHNVFCKIKFINKLMHSAKFRRDVDLIGGLIAIIIGFFGLLLAFLGTGTEPWLSLVGVGLILLCAFIAFLIHISATTAMKYHTFIYNKTPISSTARIIKNGNSQASVVIKAADEKGVICKTQFILRCVCSTKVNEPTLDISKAIVYFPQEYHDEF